MPAWITSLLRDDVSVPMPSAASRMITSRPARASARAAAKPTTPAPNTMQSTHSNVISFPGLMRSTPPILHGPVRRRHSAKQLAGATVDLDQGDVAMKATMVCTRSDTSITGAGEAGMLSEVWRALARKYIVYDVPDEMAACFDCNVAQCTNDRYETCCYRLT